MMRRFAKSLSTKPHQTPAKLSYLYNQNDSNLKDMMLLHGLMGSKSNWGILLNNNHIKHQCNFIRVDLRNHGASGHHSNMQYSDMAYDLLNLISEEEKLRHIKKLTVLGHSMGGKVAIAFACLFPDIVEGLIVLDSSPFNYLDSQNIFTHLISLVEDLDNLIIKDKTRKELNDELHSKFGTKEGSLLATNLSIGPDLSENSWRINLKSIRHNIKDILGWKHVGQYRGPTIVLVGDKSRKFELSEFQASLPNLQQSDIVEIKNSGHWVHADNPEEVAINIQKFLFRLDNHSDYICKP